MRNRLLALGALLLAIPAGAVDQKFHGTADFAAALSPGSLTNAMVNSAAGIVYSKLSLAGSVTNADLAGSIADGKLLSSYVYANGTRPLTADWSLGAFSLTAGKYLTITNLPTNTTATGTATTIYTGGPNTKGLIVQGTTNFPSIVNPASVSNTKKQWLRPGVWTLTSSKISTWTDQFASGNNATQTNASERPTVASAAMNGLDCAQFGTGTRMKVVNSMAQSSGTWFVVYKIDDTSGGSSGYSNLLSYLNSFEIWAIDGSTPTQTPVFLGPNTSGGGAGAVRFSGVNGTDTSAHYMRVTWNGGSISSAASYTGSWMGSTTTITTAGTYGAPVDNTIGDRGSGGFVLKGKICEIIGYDGSLSAGDESGVEAYLADEFNLSFSAATQQAANLQEWQSDDGTALGSFSAAGAMTAASFVGPLTGNASTATALAANPTDCSSNQFANAIAASGNLNCAQPAFTDLSGTIAASQLPNPSDDAAVITSDFTTTSGTGVDVTGLSVAVAANTNYSYSCHLDTGSGTSGIKAAITLPSGAVLLGHAFGVNTGSTTFREDRMTTSGTLTGAFSVLSSSATFIRLNGRIRISSTAGNFKVQVASGDGAQTVSVFVDSFCELRKMTN